MTGLAVSIFTGAGAVGVEEMLPRIPLGYASRTGTLRNLAALREAGWRLLVSARGVWRNEGFAYAIDNGAWTAFQQREPFCERSFLGVIEKLGPNADWIVLPDIVLGGLDSLRFSLSWLKRLDTDRPRLIAVQNGVEPADVRGLLGREVGLFIGGDTRWKEETLPVWGELAQQTGCHLHVGRVNTARRVRLCSLAGATSFDGTSPSRFAKTLVPLDGARRQRVLFLETGPLPQEAAA